MHASSGQHEMYTTEEVTTIDTLNIVYSMLRKWASLRG